MKFRTLLLGLTALFVAFNAAFFSVTGLSKLFAGASISVILMASSLELAKLIVAGYLYNYWEKINKAFRYYLLGATMVLVLITSLGIYGFLTSAFQETFNTYSITSKEKTFLQQKEKFWDSDVKRYDTELERISQNISTLSSAKTQQIQYTDRNGKTQSSVSTTELRAAQSRIAVEEQNRKEVQTKRQIAADSLQSIQLKILEIDTNTEVGSELGPLQYLSGLLGKPMDQIINWFILIIIFVFDPLAVALVVAFNNAVKVDKGENDKKKVIEKRELYGEISDESTITENIMETNDKEKQRELIKEIIQADEKDGLYDEPILTSEKDAEIFFESINKDLEPNETLKEAAKRYSDEVRAKHTYIDDFKIEDELVIDKNGDGVISEEEYLEWYETGGWKSPYKGGPYYTNPIFDWNKRERWINDRKAIDYWINFQGGTQKAVEEYRTQSKYPEDFTTKTY